MSILTVIIADTSEEATSMKPPLRSGFTRQESLEEYELPEVKCCPTCKGGSIQTGKIRKHVRLSITDTR